MKRQSTDALTARLFLLLSVFLTAVLVVLARPRALPLAIHTIRADDALLRQVRATGATFIVQVFSWHDIQPSPNRWEWEYTDWLVRAADYYGLQVIARLDKPPAWVVEDARALAAPPRHLEEYATFVRRVAERYRGKVAAYIIWNEPNLAVEWGNQRPDARAYAALLQVAAARIRAADPGARIVAAALAPTNENSARAQDDRAFLRELYAAGARDAFDILAVHPYGFGQSPDDPRGAHEGLNFARILDWREIMVAHGDAAKPLWITEFGYPSETPAGYESLRVTEEQQARYLRRAYERARDEWPWVQLFTVWNMARGLPADDEQSGYSLLRRDGSPKPALDALRQLQTRSPLVEWGQWFAAIFFRPAPSAAYPVLARDAIVHLGDSEYPAPWVPLYRTQNPSVEWKGEFYLRDVDLDRRGDREWTLTMELMQVNDFDSRVWVNDVPLTPPFLPAENFTSQWVTAQFRIPPGTLRVGYNAVSLHNGKLLPALQQHGFTWDEFQFRHVMVLPP